MSYEELLIEADSCGLTIKEKPLRANDGRITGNKIAIRDNIETSVEKSCVLAEELGHYHTSAGDILDQATVQNRKQEQRARLWAYNRQIGLVGLIKAFEHGCQNLYEIADYLEVTVIVLTEALEAYRKKYGVLTTLDNYLIRFEPNLSIMKLI